MREKSVKIILVELDSGNGPEADAFLTRESLRNYLIDDLTILDDNQFLELWENSEFEAGFLSIRIFKDYTVI